MLGRGPSGSLAAPKGGAPAVRAASGVGRESFGARLARGGPAAAASRLVERKWVVDGGPSSCEGDVGPVGGRESESKGMGRAPDGSMSRCAAMGVAEYMCMPPACPRPVPHQAEPNTDDRLPLIELAPFS